MAKTTFIKRLMMWFFISLAAIGALIALTITLVIPSLPSLESLTEYRPKLPLRVYSSDGFLMAELFADYYCLVQREGVYVNCFRWLV